MCAVFDCVCCEASVQRLSSSILFSSQLNCYCPWKPIKTSFPIIWALFLCQVYFHCFKEEKWLDVCKKLFKVYVFWFLLSTLNKSQQQQGDCRLFVKCLHYCCCACKAFHSVEAQMQFARITVEDLTLKTQWLLDFHKEVDIFQLKWLLSHFIHYNVTRSHFKQKHCLIFFFNVFFSCNYWN